jgi:hypothetical protein
MNLVGAVIGAGVALGFISALLALIWFMMWLDDRFGDGSGGLFFLFLLAFIGGGFIGAIS